MQLAHALQLQTPTLPHYLFLRAFLFGKLYANSPAVTEICPQLWEIGDREGKVITFYDPMY